MTMRYPSQMCVLFKGRNFGSGSRKMPEISKELGEGPGYFLSRDLLSPFLVKWYRGEIQKTSTKEVENRVTSAKGRIESL